MPAILQAFVLSEWYATRLMSTDDGYAIGSHGDRPTNEASAVSEELFNIPGVSADASASADLNNVPEWPASKSIPVIQPCTHFTDSKSETWYETCQTTSADARASATTNVDYASQLWKDSKAIPPSISAFLEEPPAYITVGDSFLTMRDTVMGDAWHSIYEAAVKQ